MSQYGRSSQSWHKHAKKPKKGALSKLPLFFKKGELLKNVILAGLICFFLGIFCFFLLFIWYSKDLPDPGSLINRDIPLSTKIYDRTGEVLLYEISSGEKRTLVTLDEIPDDLERATLAAEDRKFFQHNGIDVKGIMRAAFGVITFRNLGGGSTITQQLVKNAILTNERTLTRKMKEIILSLALERRYSKEEILQLYLNEIPYGSTNYGAESAARAYFGKSVSDLTLAESATLAGLPQSPTTYLNNPDRLRARRDWILNSMYDLSYISIEQRDEALATETPVRANVSNIIAPHFVLWVKEQLVEKYGERMVEEGGLRVITTLDANMQQIAEEVVSTNVEERGPGLGFNNASLVAVSPADGGILSMVGSADYFNDDIDGQVNVALRPRQPGSSFKPIIFANAFERGYTPNTILWDVKTTFPSTTGPYEPKNFDGKEHGPLTIRTALQWSLNIPAVKALYLVGVESGLQFAERLGYTTFADRSRFGLAVVLGGGEVLAVEHASAYSVFASEGMYRPAYAIQAVYDKANNPLFEYEISTNERRVLDANIARMVSSVLSDDASRAAIFGAGGNLTLPGRPVAAKTGTTNDSKDAWTAGYTPDIATVVWAGNTDGHAMKGAGGSTAAAPIWNAFMRRAHEGLTPKSFTPPEIPTTGKPVLDGQMPLETFEIDTVSGYLATEFTPARFREQKSCGEYHSILNYVLLDNPAGDPPKDPERADSAWQTWEDAIENYIERFNTDLLEGATPYERCVKPTEYDNVHTRTSQPSIDIQSPNNREAVSNTVTISFNTSAPRGTISRIEYILDDTVIDISPNTTTHPLSIPRWVNAGTHKLTIRAYDDIDNAGEDSVQIQIMTDGIEAGVIITNPFANQEILTSTTPYIIATEVQGNADILRLETYALGSPNPLHTQEILDPHSAVSIPWTIPEPGLYQLRASILTEGTWHHSGIVSVRIIPAPTIPVSE